jgi:hypothetical protein
MITLSPIRQRALPALADLPVTSPSAQNGESELAAAPPVVAPSGPEAPTFRNGVAA